MSGDLERKLDQVLSDLEFIKNRLTIRIGPGTSLTYLRDETPIYVNDNDFGCAADLINGGAYEEENFGVLASFLRPDSVILDVGANIGIFAVRLAGRLKTGRVIAFEPHPRVFEVMKQNVAINGLGAQVDTRNAGLSDKNSRETLYVPGFSIGGSTITPARPASAYAETILCDFQRFDDGVPEDFTCDIVKLDVEGNEFAALAGMKAMLKRSAPQVKILFEKLGATTDGRHERTHELMEELGLPIYKVEPPCCLVPVDRNQFMAQSGYYLAARSEIVESRLRRGFFSIYPAQLNIVMPHRIDSAGRAAIQAKSAPGSIVFHGPYWYLPKGRYDIRILGGMKSPLEITIAERFGRPVAAIPCGPNEKISYRNDRDLVKFELLARTVEDTVDLQLERIEVEKLD